MSPEAAGPGNWEATSTEEATNKGKMALDDSLGTCRFNSGMDMEVSAEAISAVTGWDFSPEEAFTVGAVDRRQNPALMSLQRGHSPARENIADLNDGIIMRAVVGIYSLAIGGELGMVDEI